MKKTICLLLCIITLNVYAQQKPDTTKKLNIPDTLKKDLFTAPDTVPHLHSKFISLVPPTVLIAYGASTFAVHPLRRVDYWVYGEAQEHTVVPTSKFENVVQYSPMALVYGLNLVGVHGKNTFVDRTIILVISQAFAQGTAQILKHAAHRLRPDNSDYFSFPSGHTTNAFVGAEFMAQELGDKSIAYSAIGYSLATITGISRIAHKDHWFSDVIAGAGLGILSTKAAYLFYPYVRNRLFKAGREKEDDKNFKKKEAKSAILLPSYQNGALGFTFSAQL